MERLYSTSTFAEMLDVHVNEVLRLIKAGKLHAIPFRGARCTKRPHYRIPESSARRFMNHQTQGDAEEKPAAAPKQKKVRGELVTQYY